MMTEGQTLELMMYAWLGLCPEFEPYIDQLKFAVARTDGIRVQWTLEHSDRRSISRSFRLSEVKLMYATTQAALVHLLGVESTPVLRELLSAAVNANLIPRVSELHELQSAIADAEKAFE